jgi:predicted flap endonuclease-1-like 5' DNA nuclease
MTFSANVNELFEGLGEGGPVQASRKMMESFWATVPYANPMASVWTQQARDLTASWFGLSMGLAATPALVTQRIVASWAAAPARDRAAARAPAVTRPTPVAKPDTTAAAAAEPVAVVAPDVGTTDPALAAAPPRVEPVGEPAAFVAVDPAAAPEAATAVATVGTADPVADLGPPPGLEGPRDGLADDLKLISGIGPKIERTLNSLGIYHFDQIAAWNDRETQWVDDHLKFSGRIRRDEWLAQAEALASGGVAEYVARFGKEPR